MSNDVTRRQRKMNQSLIGKDFDYVFIEELQEVNEFIEKEPGINPFSLWVTCRRIRELTYSFDQLTRNLDYVGSGLRYFNTKLKKTRRQ